MSRLNYRLLLSKPALVQFGAGLVVVSASLLMVGNANATTVVFSDDFSSSTVPISPTTYPATTATSTGYAIASSRPQSPAPSVSTGHLTFGVGQTNSGIEQAQALFTNSPVTLSNTGDFVEMKLTFTNTGILTSTASTSNQIDFGMFSSGGSAPSTDVSSTGLLNTLTNHATGGVQLWTGYVSQVFVTGGSSAKIITRPAQTAGTENTDQDLITSGASGSQSFHSPTGTSLGNTGTDSTLVTGHQYSEDFTITLTAANTYTVTSVLADVTTSTTLSSQSKTATGANFFSGSFDGLVMGWRETANVASGTAMDVNSLLVQTNVTPVPEPTSLVLLGLGGIGMGLVMRRRIAG